MTLKRRVSIYLIGLFIGCAMVFFMFPNWDWFGWTPNKTLMKQIRESKWEVSERGQCMTQCTATINEQIQAIRNNGKIDFSKSDTHSNPKKYRVQYGEVGLDVLLTDTLVTLDGIETRSSSTCNCR